MSLFHRHRWGRATVTYTPPQGGNFEWRQHVSEDLIKTLAFGSSAVSQTCVGCGKARTYTVPGDARPAGESTGAGEGE